MAGRLKTRLGRQQAVRFEEPVTVKVLTITPDFVELAFESHTGERIRCEKVGQPGVLEKALTKANNKD